MTDVSAINEELPLDEQSVKDYLQANPQFFSNNPDLLLSLRLHHNERGTISLVERQQEILRTKVQILEEEITTLMTVARQNEGIFMTFSELYLQIIESTDESQLYHAMLEILNQKLNLPGVYLKCFAKDGLDFHIEKSDLQGLIDHRLAKKDYYFGRLSSDESAQLFESKLGIKSAALMLLGKDGETGIVAFGSTDENHFYPGMDTLFLSELSKILALMLEKFK